ncbi:MAG: NAD(P)-binding domain-containing protein, partial [Acidobacteria bacterium]|nr:NAD(P)-binding domain-containing protein [Acidobacteriota bacterium]
MVRIAVIGAGSWGTALSIIAGRAGHSVRLWSRNESVVEEINHRHVNSAYLRPYVVPESVRATDKIGDAVHGAEFVLLAAPSHVTRELLLQMLDCVSPQML